MVMGGVGLCAQAGNYEGAVAVLLWILAVVAAAALYIWVVRRPEEEAAPAAAKPGSGDGREFV